MATDKKRVNITIKKAPTPFQFPGSKTTPISAGKVNSDLNSPIITGREKLSSGDIVSNGSVSNGSVSNGSGSNGDVSNGNSVKKIPTIIEITKNNPETVPENVSVPVSQPVKRGRGRPRKDDKEKEAQLRESLPGATGAAPATATGTAVAKVDTRPPAKKRGRKPRNNSVTEESTNDKVYSLFGGKPTVNIDNFENLSYIVNLKITKSRADKIYSELQRTRIGKGTEAGSGAETGRDISSLPQPSREAIKSFNNLCSNQKLSSVYKLTYPRIDRRKVNLGERAFRPNTSGGGAPINLDSLKRMEQVTVRTQMSSGYVDCYLGELMPGFAMGDRWPNRSDYPCRNCDETFTNTPAGLVRKIEGDFEVDPQNCKFYLYFNFCSWSCAFRFAQDRFPDPTEQQYLLNFCYNTVQKRINDSHKWSKIKIAPKLCFLRKNGGHLSIDQYRAATDSNRSYNLYIPPLIPLRMTLEESSRDITTRTSGSNNTGSRGKKKYVPMDANRMKKAEMSIRNRKNSVRGSMTIDKLMKMEIKTN